LLGDRWENNDFIREIEAANEATGKQAEGCLVLGLDQGRRTRSAKDGRVRSTTPPHRTRRHWVCEGPRLTAGIPKSQLPKYRIFDDAPPIFIRRQSLAAELEIRSTRFCVRLSSSIDGTPVKIGVFYLRDLWKRLQRQACRCFTARKMST